MNGQINTRTAGLVSGEMTREVVDLIKRTVCVGATDDELKLFVQVCQRTGLDPFARQIYAVFRKDDKSPTGKRMTIQTSIDGFRLIAQRSREYAGQVGPEWCGEDGAWRDVWLSKTPPSAARLGVLRAGFEQPVWAVALWSEFCQVAYGKPTNLWANLPTVMLAKCAESQALRRVFPQELSGLYSEEEMGQAENAEPEGIDWTEDELTEAKAMVMELGDALMEAGMDEAEMVAATRKAGEKIGDPTLTLTTWTNRFLGFRDRQIAKAKKEHPTEPAPLPEGAEAFMKFDA